MGLATSLQCCNTDLCNVPISNVPAVTTAASNMALTLQCYYGADNNLQLKRLFLPYGKYTTPTSAVS